MQGTFGTQHWHAIAAAVIFIRCEGEYGCGFLQGPLPKIMDEVQAKRETVEVTKHGKSVAKLVPVDTDTHAIYNFLADNGLVVGDVVSPAISSEEWGNLK